MTLKASIAALALLALSACGPSPFIGTFSITGGTDTATCNGIGGSSNPTGNITFANGTNGNIESTDTNGCDLSWTESGNTLTIVAGQSCSDTSNGVTFDVAFSAGTVTLANNLATATLTGAGTANGLTCTFSDTITGTKVAN